MPPVSLRDLLDFKAQRRAVPLDEVESITEIRKRFVTPGMSLGALGPGGARTLNIAMNRIGAKSDSGEGGEDPRALQAAAQRRQRQLGRSSRSRRAASASPRNTSTTAARSRSRSPRAPSPARAASCPASRSRRLIAKLRHATPGVMLISPPPHHDIYSIEDLAQLIYDLKQINPDAARLREAGGALRHRHDRGGRRQGQGRRDPDLGHSGGTGASPQTSIKYAGLPWEMGLTEAHQVLTLNPAPPRHAAHRRRPATGRDIVIAAMLGAEEFGIGTASAGRHGLHHGAPVPFQHLPGRRLHAGRGSCAPSSPARPTRSSTCSASSPKRCARSSPARLHARWTR
jgi:glutamate synthase (NADPH/NADH) large chain